MAELTVDLTYGNALFSAAKELNKVDLILEESVEFLSILEREPDLRVFLDSPAISAREKKAALVNIFEGKICDELLNFLRVLIDKRRTKHFAKIVNVYTRLTRKEEGVSYGEIFSVAPLDESRLHKFEEETGRLLRQKVKLESKLDAALIGGVKIRVDGKILDASVQGRLKDLRSNIG